MVSQCLHLRARAASVMEAAFVFHLSGVNMSNAVLVLIQNNEVVEVMPFRTIGKINQGNNPLDGSPAISIRTTDGKKTAFSLDKTTNANEFLIKLSIAMTNGESQVWKFYPNQDRVETLEPLTPYALDK